MGPITSEIISSISPSSSKPWHLFAFKIVKCHLPKEQPRKKVILT